MLNMLQPDQGGNRVSRPPQSYTENDQASPTTALVARPSSGLTAAERQTALESMLQQFRIKRRGPGSSFGTSIGSAFEALWSNRTRSFLTMLGIFIGVAAVVASMTLTQSVSAYFTNIIEGLGANTILIEPGSNNSRGVVSKQSQHSLTLKDVQSIERVNHVSAISP